MAVVDTLIQTSLLLRGLRVTMAFSNPLPGTYLGARLSCSAPVAVGVSEPTNQWREGHVLLLWEWRPLGKRQGGQLLAVANHSAIEKALVFVFLFGFVSSEVADFRDQTFHRTYLALWGQKPKSPGFQWSNLPRGKYSSPIHKSLEIF